MERAAAFGGGEECTFSSSSRHDEDGYDGKPLNDNNKDQSDKVDYSRNKKNDCSLIHDSSNNDNCDDDDDDSCASSDGIITIRDSSNDECSNESSRSSSRSNDNDDDSSFSSSDDDDDESSIESHCLISALCKKKKPVWSVKMEDQKEDIPTQIMEKVAVDPCDADVDNYADDDIGNACADTTPDTDEAPRKACDIHPDALRNENEEMQPSAAAQIEASIDIDSATTTSTTKYDASNNSSSCNNDQTKRDSVLTKNHNSDDIKDTSTTSKDVPVRKTANDKRSESIDERKTDTVSTLSSKNQTTTSTSHDCSRSSSLSSKTCDVPPAQKQSQESNPKKKKKKKKLSPEEKYRRMHLARVMTKLSHDNKKERGLDFSSINLKAKDCISTSSDEDDNSQHEEQRQIDVNDDDNDDDNDSKNNSINSSKLPAAAASIIASRNKTLPPLFPTAILQQQGLSSVSSVCQSSVFLRQGKKHIGKCQNTPVYPYKRYGRTLIRCPYCIEDLERTSVGRTFAQELRNKIASAKEEKKKNDGDDCDLTGCSSIEEIDDENDKEEIEAYIQQQWVQKCNNDYPEWFFFRRVLGKQQWEEEKIHKKNDGGDNGGDVDDEQEFETVGNSKSQRNLSSGYSRQEESRKDEEEERYGSDDYGDIMGNTESQPKKKRKIDKAEQSNEKTTPTKENRIDQQWEEMFQLLKRYKQQHRNISLARVQDARLNKWITTQRSNKRKLELSESRMKQLDSIGFLWSIKDQRDQEWEEMFQRLETYKKEHGHCIVPCKYKHDRKLGRWVNYQRERKMLPDDKKHRLDLLGFVWSGRKPNQLHKTELKDKNKKAKTTDTAASERTASDVKMADEGGKSSSSPPSSDSSSSRTLSRKQRMMKRGLDQEWSAMFKRLQDYQLQHGDCVVPQSSDKILCKWINAQRSNKRQSKLSISRIQQLESIGFAWDLPLDQKLEQQWKGMFQELQKYKQKNGDCDVKEHQNSKLYHWAKRQRYAKKQSKLSASREHRLESIDFIWNKQEHGRKISPAAVASSSELDSSLPGEAVDNIVNRTQENSHQKDCSVAKQNNNKERKKKDIVPQDTSSFCSSSSTPLSNKKDIKAKSEQKWNKMFQKLQNYKLKHGNCRVPRNYPSDRELAAWVISQKRQKTLGKLSSSKQRLLESIDFMWSGNHKEIFEQQWDEMFEQVQDHKLNNETCHLQRSKDRKLYDWFNKQKTRRKQGKLSSSRSERFKSIGLAWDENEKEEKLDESNHYTDDDDDDNEENIMEEDYQMDDDMNIRDDNNDNFIHLIPTVCEDGGSVDDDYSSLTASVSFSPSLSSVGSSRGNASRKRCIEEVMPDSGKVLLNQEKECCYEKKVPASSKSEAPVPLPPPLRRWLKRKKLVVAAAAAASPNQKSENEVSKDSNRQREEESTIISMDQSECFS